MKRQKKFGAFNSIDIGCQFPINSIYAGVVKVVDARDSKSRGGDPVSVRFRPPAPDKFKGLAREPVSPFCSDTRLPHKLKVNHHPI